MLSLNYFTATSVRGRVVNLFLQEFLTLDAAKIHYGMQTIPLQAASGSSNSSSVELATNTFLDLPADDQVQCLQQIIDSQNKSSAEVLVDAMYFALALKQNIGTNPKDFASLSLKAMKLLERNKKPNLLYHFAQCICYTRPKESDDEPDVALMPMDRMPFGLIEYQIEFFSCSNVKQVS